MKKKAQPGAWKSRIVGSGEEDPRKLIPNPKNWRRHPEPQRSAVANVLGDVGWVTGIIVNKTTGHILDGHLRASEAAARGEATVPVTYVELTEEEEKKALATFDPLTGMAVTDDDALHELIGELKLDSPEFSRMMEGVLPSDSDDDAKVEPVKIKPQPELVWYLIGIPLSKFGDAQDAVAKLEAMSLVTVQSSRDEDRETDLVNFVVTKDQATIIQGAVAKLRENEEDEKITEGRALELIAADFLSGE